MTRRISGRFIRGAACARASVTLTAVGALSAALVASAARAPDPLSHSIQQTLAPSRQDAAPLEAGTALEGELARGDAHRYQLTLTAGEYVSAIVEQRGLDVVVQLRGTDDRVIADFQDDITRRGQEQVEWVATRSGVYTLAIKPAVGISAPGSYAIRLAGRRTATEADRSMHEARTLRTAARALEATGKFSDARPLFERALTLTEAVRGPDDALVGEVLFEIAGNALQLRENARAETLFQRAIAVLEQAWGTGHPYTAMARSRLALVQQRAGQGPKAEALLRQALEVIERTLGADHPWFASCLITQANLRDEAGDLEKAEEIDRRALAIMERIEDTRSVNYASLLGNLGEVYRQKGDLGRAEELYRRGLTLTEQLEGTDSYRVSTAYQNLGIVARERKEYARAIEYDTHALSIRERIVGPGHPDIAPLLNNLAIIYRLTGDDARSLDMHFRALRIWESAAGPYHRGTLTSVGNIARTYAATGDLANAIAFQRRADAIIETQLGLQLSVGSERQKLAFVKSVSERTDRTISLSLNDAAGRQDATSLAALVLLQRKGRVLDAMIDTFAAVRQRVADPGERALLDQLKTTTAQLARLALTAPEDGQPDRQHPIKELEARKERLEAELSAHSAELRAQMQPVTLAAVQAAMPDNAALLEFAVFRPFDPRAERNVEAYGPPHYAAYVVGKHGAPRSQDLGAARTIDEMIDALRQALRDPARTDLHERARALDEQVMRPLRASLGAATRLLISPDGELNLVPFDALIDEQGRYLIERYAMSYLTSGRDLLRMQVPRVPRGNPVIVADPLFGEPAMPMGGTGASAPPPGRGVTAPDEVSPMYFAPLACAADEARAIKALFPEATLLTGRRATKATLERLEAPRMLHIASHGYFLQDAGRDTAKAPAPANGDTRALTASVTVDNPLLRSGLALAGANLTRDPHDDGILTAMEASGLNLWGTKLVTLSACDTGVGEIRNGEGVYGLRRSFVLAGTETLLMSLWPVSDCITGETMVAYYTGLRAGLGRGDALRQAKLAMLRQKDRRHPFYWASFILSGEWGSLDGRR